MNIDALTIEDTFTHDEAIRVLHSHSVTDKAILEFYTAHGRKDYFLMSDVYEWLNY